MEQVQWAFNGCEKYEDLYGKEDLRFVICRPGGIALRWDSQASQARTNNTREKAGWNEGQWTY